MDINHVSKVKEAVGVEGIGVLSEIFNKTQLPSGVPVQRFRADHPKWIPAIDRVETSGVLLERIKNSTEYRVKLFALPLIGSQHATVLLQNMEKCFKVLKELYREQLNRAFAFHELLEATALPENVLREVLLYMLDAHGWWTGHSIDFPYDDKPSLTIGEASLTNDAFYNFIAQTYEWHFVNAEKNAPTWAGLLERINDSGRAGFFTVDDVEGRPAWYEGLDPTMKAVIGEIDKALRVGLSALPTVGIRTLIDSVMSDKGYASGTFTKRLEQFTEAGWLSQQYKDMLDIVLDMGNASAHRAYFPGDEDLRTCVEVVKHLLHGVYILRPRVDMVGNNTPRRKKES